MSNIKKTLIIGIVVVNVIAGYGAWLITERVEALETGLAMQGEITQNNSNVYWERVFATIERLDKIENRQETLRKALAVEYVPEEVVPATYKATNQLLHFHRQDVQPKSTQKVIDPQQQTKVPTDD